MIKKLKRSGSDLAVKCSWRYWWWLNRSAVLAWWPCWSALRRRCLILTAGATFILPWICTKLFRPRCSNRFYFALRCALHSTLVMRLAWKSGLKVFAHCLANRSLSHHLFDLESSRITSYLPLDVEYLSLPRRVVMVEESDVAFNTSIHQVLLWGESSVPIAEVFVRRGHAMATFRFIFGLHDVPHAVLNASCLLSERKVVVSISRVKIFAFKLLLQRRH